MYLLYADDQHALAHYSRLFTEMMEPLLAALETHVRASDCRTFLPEIEQYLQVCRWPFRKLEYSFTLDALLDHLQPGDRFLDAGSGVTPLAHVLAARGIRAEACDADGRVITGLQQLDSDRIYASHVAYAIEDLTHLSYPDASFDAISCVSVLEHIPAPHDQRAVRELLRILRPGGILVLTIDFTPGSATGAAGKAHGYQRRVVDLARRGDLREIGRGFLRKVRARWVVHQGLARQPRSANECFRVEHIEQDIAPLLREHQELASGLPFSIELRSATPAHAQQFWDLEPGLFDRQGRRVVLPAACIVRKSSAIRPVYREANLGGQLWSRQS
jgi:2-polyprenyl-3-methyl-5-hydroxy-6-metoxy-1,4-benzoquinol methylase